VTSLRAFAVAMAAVALVGCFDPDRVNGPVVGWENDPEACDDGIDNDRDGMTDCSDSSCIAAGLCGLIIIEGLPPEPENTYEKCIDRIDNDQDGNYDCGDRNCQAIMELCCTTEFSDAACSDGFDNDENGFRDCGDFSCRQSDFVTVCDAETDCDDGRDNDEDGRVDCADTDCAEVDGCPPLPSETCDNGRDDDGDGDTDCEDADCLDTAGCPASGPEDTIEACSDGVDNDGNGFTDCGDFSCSRATGNPDLVAFCETRLENNVERCSDGEDNDGNGFTDCNDFSCSRSTIPEVAQLCTGGVEVDEEDSFEECKNGEDDDGDGFGDCSDFSCQAVIQANYPVPRRSPDGAGGYTFDTVQDTASPCRESISLTDAETNPRRAIAELQERCLDNRDQDIDGFYDCDDWDCQWNPLLKPTVEDRMRNGATAEEAAVAEDGMCQGWRFTFATGRWDLTAVGNQANRPLLCR